VDAESQQLRVLVANESRERLAAISAVTDELGHRVVAGVTAIEGVAEATSREHPDVALVGLGESSEHALALISQIVGESECPVIALLGTDDRRFVSEAAKRGIFAYVVDAEPDSLRSALEIVLLRFAEYHGLEGAFGRRAIIERAKGIVMERYGLDEREAFEALRSHARNNNKKIVDVANDLIGGRLLLPPG
jgi:response regulator NasT